MYGIAQLEGRDGIQRAGGQRALFGLSSSLARSFQRGGKLARPAAARSRPVDDDHLVELVASAANSLQVGLNSLDRVARRLAQLLAASAIGQASRSSWPTLQSVPGRMFLSSLSRSALSLATRSPSRAWLFLASCWASANSVVSRISWPPSVKSLHCGEVEPGELRQLRDQALAVRQPLAQGDQADRDRRGDASLGADQPEAEFSLSHQRMLLQRRRRAQAAGCDRRLAQPRG